MLRIAYCQISAHPAYCGANGNFCREPVYDAGGAVLTETSQIGTVNEICDKIYGLYTKKFCLKIQHLLQTLKREEIDILVFPEYTVPADVCLYCMNFAKVKTVFVSRHHIQCSRFTNRYIKVLI